MMAFRPIVVGGVFLSLVETYLEPISGRMEFWNLNKDDWVRLQL